MASAGRIDTNPPEYKKELEIWKAFTSLEKKKQGPALYLSLRGKAKEAVKELSVAEISTDDGIQAITNKLDKLFKKDDSQSAYLAYSEFENFKRPSSMPMKDFIAKFEVLNATIRGWEMTLSDLVLAYRLLQSANMNDEEMRLCRATLPELKIATMKTHNCSKSLVMKRGKCWSILISKMSQLSLQTKEDVAIGEESSKNIPVEEGGENLRIFQDLQIRLDQTEKNLDVQYVIQNFTGHDNVLRNIDQRETNTTQQLEYVNMQKRKRKMMMMKLDVMTKMKMRYAFFNQNTMNANSKDWSAKR
jgi:hypothetical protein